MDSDEDNEWAITGEVLDDSTQAQLRALFGASVGPPRPGLRNRYDDHTGGQATAAGVTSVAVGNRSERRRAARRRVSLLGAAGKPGG